MYFSNDHRLYMYGRRVYTPPSFRNFQNLLYFFFFFNIEEVKARGKIQVLSATKLSAVLYYYRMIVFLLVYIF